MLYGSVRPVDDGRLQAVIAGGEELRKDLNEGGGLGVVARLDGVVAHIERLDLQVAQGVHAQDHPQTVRRERHDPVLVDCPHALRVVAGFQVQGEGGDVQVAHALSDPGEEAVFREDLLPPVQRIDRLLQTSAELDHVRHPLRPVELLAVAMQCVQGLDEHLVDERDPLRDLCQCAVARGDVPLASALPLLVVAACAVARFDDVTDDGDVLQALDERRVPAEQIPGAALGAA
mmetsp:Transcript_47726/g.139117  ORF Transcript_47726/g.139117 Transcript_47726/m.139117 type:complete len:232 (+) Transcript_47726:1227-1922(+)